MFFVFYFFNETATPEIYTVLTHSFPTRRSSVLNLFNELITRLSDAGYASDDIQWAENTKPPEHAEEFATETIFVICNSGMKHTIARKIFDKCMEAKIGRASCRERVCQYV